MKTNTAKTEPFHFNNEKYISDMKTLENKVPSIQSVVDAYYKIEGIPHLIPSELDEILTNTISFLSKKIIAMYGVTFNGLELKEDKLFDMFKKPEGVDDFLNAVQEAKDVLTSSGYVANTLIGIQDFVLEKNKVSVKKETLERVKKMNSCFFENDKQESAHELLSVIAEKYNALRDIMGGRLEYKEVFEDGLGYGKVGIMSSTTKVEINPNYIQRIK